MKAQTSSDFYRSLFDGMLDGLAYCQMVFDPQGRPVDWIYVEVNRNFERLTGLKEIVGKKVTEAIPGIVSSNPELFEIYGRVSLTGKPESFETYVKPLSRWFLVSVYSPKKKFFMAVFRNITDKKQIEDELKNAKIAARNVLEDLGVEKSELERARAKEEAILLSIGDGLIFSDKKERITFVNKAAEKLLGLKNEKITGKIFSEVVRMEDEKGMFVPFQKRPVNMALSTGTTTTSTIYYYVRKDKTKFPVAITVTPVKLESKIIGAIEVFRDITRETEVDKAKSEFISLASHQLRTPLSEIKWYSEILSSEDGSSLSEDQKKYVLEIASASKRMAELIEALLNVSRIEFGTFVIEPEPVNPREVVEMCVKELEPEIIKKKLKLTTKYDPSLPTIQADPKLLGVVCTNLLLNSVKYTPVGGQIKLAIDKEESDMMMAVSDTGLGIPKEAKAHIFEKMFRADNVRETGSDGTGLGLYIVKAIVDQSRGKIWFESEENKGTTFYVRLPLSGMQAKKGRKELS